MCCKDLGTHRRELQNPNAYQGLNDPRQKGRVEVRFILNFKPSVA